MNVLRLLWVFLALVLGGLGQPSAAQTFLAPEVAFQMQARMVSPEVMIVRYDIKPGYYMYRERFEFDVKGAAFSIDSVELPPGVVKYDPTFEKDMALFFKSVEFALPLPRDPPKTGDVVTVLLMSQGCAEAGLCYPPMQSAIQLVYQGDRYEIIHQQTIVDEGRPLGTAPVSPGMWRSLLSSGNDLGFASALSTGAVWQIMLFFLALGVLLAFTPCVLPMIPILSVLIVGQGTQVSRARGLSLAAAYVLGMSIVYTLLGVLAGISGASLAVWLQTPWVLSIFAILLVLLGLAMFDVIRIEMPTAIQAKLSATASTFKGGRVLAALAMGAISALIVGPCVAAPLAGALLYISQTGDWVLGGSALFAMAWGMGLPLLIMGASAGTLLPRAGAWMNGVKTLFGVLLFATAWWMLAPVVPNWVEILGWSFLAVFCAVLLGAFQGSPEGYSLGSAFRKALGLLLALLAIIWVIGLASGGRSLLQPLKHLIPSPVTASNVAAVSTKPIFEPIRTLAQLDQVLAVSTRPVMLDFYADWCVSCKEMEAFTFVDPAVIQRMSQFQLLKADVTSNTSDDRALLKRFRLFGPPGIMFFAPGGQELKDIRVVGFQSAARFATTLDQVLTQVR
jgi:thioredoxin:protein disulfide reductase